MKVRQQEIKEHKALKVIKGSKEDEKQWDPPVIKTDSLTASGIEGLTDRIFEHFQFMQDHDLLNQKGSERRTEAFMDILVQIIRHEFLAEMKTDPTIKKWIEKISNLDLDPYTASEQVIDMIRSAHRERLCEHKSG